MLRVKCRECIQIAGLSMTKRLLFARIFLQRLDSFAELVSSSIEYAESTTHQLQPSKTRTLNASLLKKILLLTSGVRQKHEKKSAGGGDSPHLRP